MIKTRYLSIMIVGSGILIVLGTRPCTAGPPDPARGTSIEDSLALLQQRIGERILERDQLKRMIASLNQIDSVYRPFYPSWIVLDRDLRERVRRIFRLRNTGVSPDDDLVVVTTPGPTEIMDLSIGDRHLGRLETRQLLSDSLQEVILHKDYQRRMVATPPEPPRTDELGTIPRYATFTASAFATRLLLANGLGVEGIVGREELGYHFWSSGDFSVRAIFQGLKLGVSLPLPYGFDVNQHLDPLSIRPARLVGSTGFSGEYEQSLGSNALGFRLAVGELTAGVITSKVPDSVSAYSLHTTSQLYFSHAEQWGDHAFTFTGGIGYHQVAHDMADRTAGRVNTIEKFDVTSPVLKVEYDYLGERLYGAGIQIYNSLLFVTGWVEVVRHFLFIDLKYYAPAFRAPKPWEQKYFFMLSPRIQISY